MKKLSLSLSLAAFTLVGAALNAQAGLKVGAVFLDVNTNRVIDAGDTPVPGLLIVVTNFSGTFSNTATTAADGTFSLQLPDTPQSFEDFILPSTLPSGTTEILPPFNVFDISAAATNATNFFLLEQGLHPPLKVGHVFCDANTNRMIDSGDIPVPGVLVAVTNFSGTFSNTAFTDAQGFFAVQLPEITGLYGDFIVPSSLPAGSTVVIPQELAVFQFSIPAPPSNIVTNDFLLQNPDCVTVAPMTNRCWLTGGGTIRASKSKPAFTFSGVVYPSCKASVRGGHWNVIDFTNRLHFKSTTIKVVECGTLPGLPSGSASPRTPFNFVDFQGVGTLKGMGRNHARFGTVIFTARAVDLGKPGKGRDALYLRVDDPAGNTLILISANPSSPLEVSPLTLSTGNLQIRVSGCNK
jgi:hypothetical protein